MYSRSNIDRWDLPSSRGLLHSHRECWHRAGDTGAASGGGEVAGGSQLAGRHQNPLMKKSLGD